MSENQNTQYVDRVGVFRCVVEKPQNGWFGEAGENATPFIRIPCRVVEQRDRKDDQVGKAITYQAWISENAFDRTIKTLCEAFPAWDGSLETLANDAYGFEGMECEINAQSEDYNGEKRIKAKWLNPIGGGGGVPLEKSKVDSLLKKLGRKSMAIAKTVRAEAGNPAPTPRQPAGAPAGGTPPPEDDDIPF
jgi:hypothetical protein